MELNQLRPLALIPLLLFISACEPAGASAAAEDTADIVRIPVATAAVTTDSITSSYRTTAILEAREEADVVSKVSGIVEQLYVEEGDFVKKGDVLAVLRDKEYAITAAQSAAELGSIEQELARMKDMAERDMISADAYDKLRFQAQGTAARHDLAQLNLTETRIVAPIDGFIATRYVKTGNLVKQYEAQRLFHIVDQASLQGIVHLPERELSQLTIGQTAFLSVSAYQGLVFPAQVERISPVVDRNSGTFKVVLAINNPQQQLKAGMFAQVNLHYATREQTLVVPRYAVTSLDNQHHVFVITTTGEGEIKAEKRQVELGFEDDNRVEIVAGLQADDEIVITGQNNLKDSTPVHIIAGQP